VNETALVLADVRTALVDAVAADLRRRRRIRLVATIGAAAAMLGLLASGAAAGSGWLFGAPAPARVAREMHRFERSTPPPHVRMPVAPGVPLGHSTAVATAPGYTLYLLRTAEHECFSVEPNGGESCGPLEAGSAPVELISYDVHADPRVKEDPRYAGRYGGGTVYGRASAPGAATVAITVPGVAETETADVNPKTGYFIAPVGPKLGEALLTDGSAVQSMSLADWHVVVRNAAGQIVARSHSAA
jgi:hypothetical protein